jgi:hypothetical protein
MGYRSAAASLVLALAFIAGCKSSSSAQSGSSSSAPSKATAPTETSSSIPTSTTTGTIPDPSFNNEPALTLTIPAGWNMQGMVTSSPCANLPFPVFRAYASDGLTEMRGEPVFGWRWGSRMPAGATAGCAPLTTQMTAAQFLQYYLGTLQGGVHVVGTMPISAAFQQGVQNYANGLNANVRNMAPALQANYTSDAAALRIQTVNGTFVQEQRLRVQMECVSNNNAGPFQGTGSCWARVDVLRAPQGKLDALVALVDNNNLPKAAPITQWFSAYMQRQQQQGQQMMAALRNQEQQENNMLNQQFQQIMQRSQAEHQAFMQQQESSFQSAMNNANASMNAQSTSASDWVDYALDQQTVSGPGGTANVSSAYSQTWSNGQGQWYQTNDPNSNPNGMLSGTWTQDTKVHGNGQPIQ